MFIKICGVTSVADANMIAGAGANAIGLNFYPASPRSVTTEIAQDIVQHIPPYVEPVGLFVNAMPSLIRQTVLSVGLRTLQLHGDVTPEIIADLREFSVMPSFPLREAENVEAVLGFLASCRQLGRLPSAILLDAYSPESYGGTGNIAPWPLARELVRQSNLPVILAGGLTSKNVAKAIRAVQPWGVDVASGVEVAPGRKEPFKVRSFIEEARRASS